MDKNQIHPLGSAHPQMVLWGACADIQEHQDPGALQSDLYKH